MTICSKSQGSRQKCLKVFSSASFVADDRKKSPINIITESQYGEHTIPRQAKVVDPMTL